MSTLETRPFHTDTPAQVPPVAARQSPQDQRFLASLTRLAQSTTPADRLVAPLADPDYRTVVRWIPVVVPSLALLISASILMVWSIL